MKMQFTRQFKIVAPNHAEGVEALDDLRRGVVASIAETQAADGILGVLDAVLAYAEICALEVIGVDERLGLDFCTRLQQLGYVVDQHSGSALYADREQGAQFLIGKAMFDMQGGRVPTEAFQSNAVSALGGSAPMVWPILFRDTPLMQMPDSDGLGALGLGEALRRSRDSFKQPPGYDSEPD